MVTSLQDAQALRPPAEIEGQRINDLEDELEEEVGKIRVLKKRLEKRLEELEVEDRTKQVQQQRIKELENEVYNLTNQVVVKSEFQVSNQIQNKRKDVSILCSD